MYCLLINIFCIRKLIPSDGNGSDPRNTLSFIDGHNEKFYGSLRLTSLWISGYTQYARRCMLPHGMCMCTCVILNTLHFIIYILYYIMYNYILYM